MHVIKLDYNATVENGEKLELGTFDSYGEEQLQMELALRQSDRRAILCSVC